MESIFKSQEQDAIVWTKEMINESIKDFISSGTNNIAKVHNKYLLPIIALYNPTIQIPKVGNDEVLRLMFEIIDEKSNRYDLILKLGMSVTRYTEAFVSYMLDILEKNVYKMTIFPRDMIMPEENEIYEYKNYMIDKIKFGQQATLLKHYMHSSSIERLESELSKWFGDKSELMSISSIREIFSTIGSISGLTEKMEKMIIEKKEVIKDGKGDGYLKELWKDLVSMVSLKIWDFRTVMEWDIELSIDEMFKQEFRFPFKKRSDKKSEKTSNKKKGELDDVDDNDYKNGIVYLALLWNPIVDGKKVKESDNVNEEYIKEMKQKLMGLEENDKYKDRAIAWVKFLLYFDKLKESVPMKAIMTIYYYLTVKKGKTQPAKVMEESMRSYYQDSSEEMRIDKTILGMRCDDMIKLKLR